MNFCPKCGAKIESKEMRFCPNCGHKLVANTGVSAEKVSSVGETTAAKRPTAHVNVETPKAKVKPEPEVEQPQEPEPEETTYTKSRSNTWIKKEFSASALLFWVKGQISVDYRFVRINEKNTVLGVFPAGSHTQNVPLKNISNVSLNTAYKMSRFIWGIILFFFGFAAMDASVLLGLILMVLGVGMFLNGIMTQLEIEKSGNGYTIAVPFFNKTDMQEVQQVIEDALSTDVDKTDQSLYQHRLNPNDMDNVE